MTTSPSVKSIAIFPSGKNRAKMPTFPVPVRRRFVGRALMQNVSAENDDIKKQQRARESSWFIVNQVGCKVEDYNDELISDSTALIDAMT